VNELWYHSGTGIVHQAPAFGEDDYRVCETAGIINKGKGLVCPVDANGCFTDEVKTWEGIYVKKADPLIMKDLRARGRLVHHATVMTPSSYYHRCLALTVSLSNLFIVDPLVSILLAQ
jgi:isoleucyl-tRNA synthetase